MNNANKKQDQAPRCYCDLTQLSCFFQNFPRREQSLGSTDLEFESDNNKELKRGNCGV